MASSSLAAAAVDGGSDVVAETAVVLKTLGSPFSHRTQQNCCGVFLDLEM